MFALLQRLTAGRERIATATGLADFLAGRAAFVSQKCTFDYCRARAGIGWAAAVPRRRVRSGAAALPLGGLCRRAGRCRRGGAGLPASPGRRRCRRRRPRPTRCVRRCVRHPVPAHRASWDDAVEAAEAGCTERCWPPRGRSTVSGANRAAPCLRSCRSTPISRPTTARWWSTMSVSCCAGSMRTWSASSTARRWCGC